MHNDLKNYFSFLCFKKISYYCVDINFNDQPYYKQRTFRERMTAKFETTNLLQGTVRRILNLLNK